LGAPSYKEGGESFKLREGAPGPKELINPYQMVGQAVVVIANHPTYETLKYEGTLPFKMQLPYTRKNDIRYLDTLVLETPEVTYNQIIQLAGEFYMAYGDVHSVDISVRKMDGPRATAYLELVEYQQAVSFMKRFYGPILSYNSGHSSSEDIIAQIDLTKASGIPWGPMGLKTKQDFFESDYVHCLYATPEEMGSVIWKVVPKTEWYPLFKLLASKVRTFIIPPIHLVYWMEHFFLKQNMAFKEAPWSAYGFNPYEGGTHCLASELDKLAKLGWTLISYDIVGFDREHPLMKLIYEEFRKPHIVTEYPDRLEWCIRNTTCTFILLPDGTLLYKEKGNNSGGVGTTQDNILGHAVASATALFALYHDESKVRSVKNNFFGDDNIAALPPGLPENWQSIFTKTLEAFKWKLDPLVVSNRLEDHTFLGFTFGKHRGRWIPIYPAEKLACSFVYTIERNMPLEAQFTKMYSLAVMSAPHEHLFSLMEEVFYCALANHKFSGSSVIRSLQTHGLPDRSDCLNWMAGLECTNVPSMEGGWNKVINSYVSDKWPEITCEWSKSSYERRK